MRNETVTDIYRLRPAALGGERRDFERSEIGRAPRRQPYLGELSLLIVKHRLDLSIFTSYLVHPQITRATAALDHKI
jgi:hypothetical protein